MADLLPLLLDETVPVENLKKWLSEGDCGDCCHLTENNDRRAEFVPHLSNFLRTETSWISQENPNIPTNETNAQTRKDGSDALRVSSYEHGRTQGDKVTSVGKNRSYPNNQVCNIEIKMSPKNFNRNERGTKPKRSRNEKSAAKFVPQLNNQDEFPPIGSAPLRRIKPTPASAKCVVLSPNASIESWKLPQSKSIFSSTPLLEKNDSSLKKERQLLKETQMQQRSDTRSKEIAPSDATVNKVAPTKAMEEAYISPKLGQVTNIRKLNILADLYITCVTSNLIPNLGRELYFITQLLTAQIKKGSKTSRVFVTVHDCVYFGVQVLEQAPKLLLLLDKVALRLVSDLPFLCKFSEKLAIDVHKLEAVPDTFSKGRLSSVQGVAYQEDIDNRKNFPTENGFRAFCRQRDLFYELWRERGVQHSSPSKFVRQVQQIVGHSTGPTNVAHLARLLIMQMITCCCKGQEPSDICEQSTPQELRQNPVEKLDKLKQRMLTPSHCGSPMDSVPKFEKFFHEFVRVADSASLNQHLVDQLKSKIEHLNATELSYDLESRVDDEMKHNFWSVAIKLRHLGKFLGFVVFHPYRDATGGCSSSSGFEQRSLSLPVDFLNLLDSAKNRGRLLLTVPWIAEYLSIMDSEAPNTDYYHTLLCQLIAIYRNSTSIANVYNRMFLQLTLGKLFETPTFPQSLFFLYSVTGSELSWGKKEVEVGYDSLDLVERAHLFACLPFASEIRVLLKDYFKGIQSRGKEGRKITPVSVDNGKVFREAVDRQMQLDLEDNFFHLHPTTRKTVEFVAERASSKAQRQLKENIVPRIIQDAISKSNSADGGPKTYPKEYEIYHTVKTKSLSYASEYCQKISSQAMASLLPDEITDEVASACTQISFRMAVDKVTTWLKSLLSGNYVREELAARLKEKADTDQNMGLPLDINVLVSNLCQLTHSVRSLHSGKQMAHDSIGDMLEKLGQFVRSDCKTLASVVQSIKVISQDLAFAIVVFQPSLMDAQMMELFLRLWYDDLGDTKLGCTLLCPRNLKILSSFAKRDGWERFAQLVEVVLWHCDVTFMTENCRLVVQQGWLNDVSQVFLSLLKVLFARFESLPDQKKELKAWVDEVRKMLS